VPGGEKDAQSRFRVLDLAGAHGTDGVVQVHPLDGDVVALLGAVRPACEREARCQEEVDPLVGEAGRRQEGAELVERRAAEARLLLELPPGAGRGVLTLLVELAGTSSSREATVWRL
jgi:hypothetical protein